MSFLLKQFFICAKTGANHLMLFENTKHKFFYEDERSLFDGGEENFFVFIAAEKRIPPDRPFLKGEEQLIADC